MYLQPVKIDLNKTSIPKQKTIQNFNIDAQGFRKTKNENPPTWEIKKPYCHQVPYVLPVL